MPRFLPTLRRTLGGPPRTEVKAATPWAFSQYYDAVARHGHSSTRDWPIERAVAEGYDRVMWVFKSVNTIAADSARLPFRLRDGIEDDDPIVDDHPLYRVLNKKANPLETGQIFRKRLSAQVMLSKRGAFVEVTKSNGGSVIRLDLLPPDRVKIIPGTGEDLIDHFELSKRNGDVKNLDPEKVRWFRDPHPIDPYSGTTPLESAGMSIELDHFARLYNVAFMQNDGRPGGVLAVRKTDGQGGDIDPVQMNRIEDRFGKGPQEAGKLSVIAGDLSYVDLAARPRDMQYSETSRNAKIEILSAFGIGESVLGYSAERTYDNADNELYVYWTRTMPGHNEILLTGFDEDSEDDLHGFLDTSKIEVLERAAKARRAEAREEVAAGVRSLYDYAQLAKIDSIESTPHTRALYIASGKTPLPSKESDAEALGMGTPVEEPAPGALPPGDVAGDAVAALPAPGGPPDAVGGEIAAGTEPRALPAAPPGDGAAAAALRAVAGKSVALRAIEGGYPKVRAAYRLSRKAARDQVTVSEPDEDDALALEDEIARVLDSLIERWTGRAAARLSGAQQRKGTRHWTPEYAEDTRRGTKALDTAKAVDEATWRAEAEEAVHPIIFAAAIAAATALLADMAVTPPPGYTLARMAADAVSQSMLHIVGAVGRAAANQASRLAAEVNRLDQADVALDDILAAVRSRAGRLSSWTRFVATFAATATVNGARDDAAREANRDENLDIDREWITKRDDVVRPSHHDADGQVAGLDEPFVVGVSLLMRPGDPTAPIHETANCRCRLRHRARRTGRFVSPVDMKALPRDGDRDGFVYDGTPRQMPAPLRTVRGNERAIARGADRMKSHARQAKDWHGLRLDKASGESWDDISKALSVTFATTFTTRTGRVVRAEVWPGVNAEAEDDDGRTVWSYSADGHFTDLDTGDPLGSFEREIFVYDDGDVEVYHSGMHVDPWAQGEGIAAEFNAHAFAWYRHMGVTRAQVSAQGSFEQTPPPPPQAFMNALDRDDDQTFSLLEAITMRPRVSSNGGYTWGQQGFDFAGDTFRTTIPGQLLVANAEDPGIPAVLRKWDRLSDVEQDTVHAWLALPFLPDEWWAEAANRSLLADFLDRTDLDNPPTPYELNLLGSDRPYTDPETGGETWLGKALMSRSSWLGYFDPRWLDTYLEGKARVPRKRAALLAGAFLAALGEDDDLLEVKSVRALGSAFAHGAAVMEARAYRDGDGDGFIEDGTPRQRPAPPKIRNPIARASLGKPWAEVLEGEKRRRAEIARRAIAAAMPDPIEIVLEPVERPSRVQGEAESDARNVARAVTRIIEQAGGDPALADILVLRAMEYDSAMAAGDEEAVNRALSTLLAVAARLRDLRDRSGGLMLGDSDLGTSFDRLSRLSRDAKRVYNADVKSVSARGPIDGDGDGFVYDNTVRQRPAPTRLAQVAAAATMTRWRRAVGGWMHPSGDYFLMRGVPMSSGGTNSWMIHERLDPEHIGQDRPGGTSYDKRDGAPLIELDGSSGLYKHVGDEGNLADAKMAVDSLMGVPEPEQDYWQAGRDAAEQRFGNLSVEQMTGVLDSARTALDKAEPGPQRESMQGAVDWLNDQVNPEAPAPLPEVPAHVYERVTYKPEGASRARTIYLHRPTVGGNPDGLLGEFLTGMEVNREGDDISGRGFDDRRHVIALDAIQRRVPMRMDNTYGELFEIEPEVTEDVTPPVTPDVTDPVTPLTEPQTRALRALAAVEDTPGRLTTAKNVAMELWPDSVGWDKRSSRGSTPAQGAMGATMPMKAAAVLARLQARGLVDIDFDGSEWRLTERGRGVLDGTAEPLPAPARPKAEPVVRTLKPKKRITPAAGTKDDPIDVNGDLDRAASLIAEGKHVRLNRVDEIGTLVARLADLVREAEAKGEQAPTYDLCMVSVPGTNLFCKQSKGIPRIKMPQLSGKPVPGSPADALDRNERGNVNIKALFREHLIGQGITVERREVDPAWMKATQHQLDGPAVGRIYAELRKGGKVGSGAWVTRDGYVLDGHHQWAAQIALDSDNGVLGDSLYEVEVIDMEIGEALGSAREFSVAQGITAAGIGAEDTARAPRASRALGRPETWDDPMSHYFAGGVDHPNEAPWNADGVFVGHERESWHANITPEFIDTVGLYATQASLRLDVMDAYRKNPRRTAEGDGYPMVTEYDGKRWVIDGHHRIAEAAERGAQVSALVQRVEKPAGPPAPATGERIAVRAVEIPGAGAQVMETIRTPDGDGEQVAWRIERAASMGWGVYSAEHDYPDLDTPRAHTTGTRDEAVAWAMTQTPVTPERSPDFGKRVGAPERRPLPGGGYLLIERIGTRTPGQTIERVILRVERRDGVWGVYPPTEQSPAHFMAGSKREADRYAMDHALGKIDPDA